jgi:hypothetical protein
MANDQDSQRRTHAKEYKPSLVGGVLWVPCDEELDSSRNLGSDPISCPSLFNRSMNTRRDNYIDAHHRFVLSPIFPVAHCRYRPSHPTTSSSPFSSEIMSGSGDYH